MKDLHGLRFLAQVHPSVHQLHIWIDSPDKKIVKLKPEIVSVKEFEITDPSLCLDQDDAQRLFDAMCNVGMRPSKDVKAEGELAATKFHLEDMRKLVFKGK